MIRPAPTSTLTPSESLLRIRDETVRKHVYEAAEIRQYTFIRSERLAFGGWKWKQTVCLGHFNVCDKKYRKVDVGEMMI